MAALDNLTGLQDSLGLKVNIPLKYKGDCYGD